MKPPFSQQFRQHLPQRVDIEAAHRAVQVIGASHRASGGHPRQLFHGPFHKTTQCFPVVTSQRRGQRLRQGAQPARGTRLRRSIGGNGLGGNLGLRRGWRPVQGEEHLESGVESIQVPGGFDQSGAQSRLEGVTVGEVHHFQGAQSVNGLHRRHGEPRPLATPPQSR